MRRRLAALLGPAIAVALLLSVVVKLPYFSEGPGPAHNVVPLIKVEEHRTYPTSDRILLTTVSFSGDRLTPLGLVRAWLDPKEDIVPEHDYLSPGETLQQESELQGYAMDQSQLDATVVVLTEVAGYPKNHGAGALIEGTLEGCDAFGKLFPGNVVTSVDGQPVPDGHAASRLIDAVPTGEPIWFEAQAGEKSVTVELVRKPCGPRDENLVGVSLTNNFPFEVSMSSGGVGGPSAGLMFGLGLYDLLTPGDLTGGAVVAGTGELWPDGTVHPIGGVQKKIYGAKAAGAETFLVPTDNSEEAKRAGVGGIRLVPVSSFEEALAALRGDTVNTASGGA